jgi:hypothetical protein
MSTWLDRIMRRDTEKARVTDPAKDENGPTSEVRVFLDTSLRVTYGDLVPAFTSQAGIEYYFGSDSPEAAATKQFFADNPNGEAQFVRNPNNQRSRELGNDVSAETMTQIDSIRGSLDVPFQGLKYQTSVNLAGVTSLTQAANVIQTDLNSTRLPAATIADASITPMEDSFTANTNYQLFLVTSGETPPAGAIVSSCPQASLGQLADLIVVNYGSNVFATFDPITGKQTNVQMEATWGKLTVPANEASSVRVGEEITGRGVPDETYVEAQTSPNTWIVNNDPSISAGDLTLWPSRLSVTVNGTRTRFEGLAIQPDPWGNFDHNYSTLGYATGYVAKALKLTSDTALALEPEGGITESWADLLNPLLAQDGFSSIEDIIPIYGKNAPSSLSAWAKQEKIPLIEYHTT